METRICDHCDMRPAYTQHMAGFYLDLCVTCYAELCKAVVEVINKFKRKAADPRQQNQAMETSAEREEAELKR